MTQNRHSKHGVSDIFCVDLWNYCSYSSNECTFMIFIAAMLSPELWLQKYRAKFYCGNYVMLGRFTSPSITMSSRSTVVSTSSPGCLSQTVVFLQVLLMLLVLGTATSTTTAFLSSPTMSGWFSITCLSVWVWEVHRISVLFMVII